MSAIKAEKGAREIIEMFLKFLLEHMENPKDLTKLLRAEEKKNVMKEENIEKKKKDGKCQGITVEDKVETHEGRVNTGVTSFWTNGKYVSLM